MLASDEKILAFEELGLSISQAKIYLSLTNNKTLKASEISKISGIARPHIYGVLTDLQALGIVEKQIGEVSTFSAVPIQNALQILLMRKKERDREIELKTRKVLGKYLTENNNQVQQRDYKFVVISGKERLMQLIRKEHDNAQRSVDILSTVQRWIQIAEQCSDNYHMALERGVKYRVLTEKPNDEKYLAKRVRALLEKPTFELRLSNNLLPTNSAIFDRKEATFTFYPSKSFGESPLILTDHPSFLSMASDHFETLWKSAETYRIAD